jgi:hypothetical protein
LPNTNLTIDWIGNEALRLAHEKCSFIGTINREFDSSYKPGYGATLRIRVPSQYTQTTGRVIDVQDGEQQSTSITVATQNHVAMRYNSQEMSQDLVNFQKLHLEPAMAQLVSYIDGICLSTAVTNTYNVVGIPGNTISTLLAPGQARGRLNQYLAPKGDRRVQLDSMMMADIVNATAAYFNPSGAISEQYREGLVARTAMADYYENDRVPALTNVDQTTSFMAGDVITNGDNTIAVSTTASNLSSYNVGEVFTIGFASSVSGGFRACHPETKQPYSHLQTFVVTAYAPLTSTITFSPTIYLSGARQNVVKSDGVQINPTVVSSGIVRRVGAGGSTYPTPLMYYRDAYTFATAALPMMTDSIRCVVKTYDGISLRVWEASDIRNDEKLTRIDILWGFAAIRPQWGCRLIGINL